ncbi:MAG: DUF3500 domain-containing protein [Pseudomonadota bacterium]
MPDPVSRRTILTGAAALVALPAQALISDPGTASAVTDAAQRFLSQADPAARFPLSGEEPTRWHWTNIRRFPRNGQVLSSMDGTQRQAAMDLVDASLSPEGTVRARQIMALERLINRDPDAYYWSVFGEPGEGDWGWRLEGHHLSHHFRISGDRVSPVPFFLGAWPNRGADGRRPLGEIEDLARDLVAGLPEDARRAAIVADRARPGHVTGNASRASAPGLQGLNLSDAGAAAAGRDLAATYLASLPKAQRDAALARATAGPMHLSWRGPLDVDRPHYWRLQGSAFTLEWDDTRNNSDHVHSVWRDYDADFDPSVGG